MNVFGTFHRSRDVWYVPRLNPVLPVINSLPLLPHLCDASTTHQSLQKTNGTAAVREKHPEFPTAAISVQCLEKHARFPPGGIMHHAVRCDSGAGRESSV